MVLTNVKLYSKGLTKKNITENDKVYHKVRPPSTIINCRTILILKNTCRGVHMKHS